MKKPRNTRQKIQKNPRRKPGLIRRVKRIVLYCSGLLFCGFLYAAYSELHGTFSSRPGRVLSWSAGTALGPLFESLPWWFWGGLAGLGLYLWVKHKLVMSIVYGVFVGIALALT